MSSRTLYVKWRAALVILIMQLVWCTFISGCRNLESQISPPSAVENGSHPEINPIRDDVLVVVNANSKSSEEIGNYYALKRNLTPNRVAKVYVTDGYFVELADYKSLRDQIIKYMMNHTLKDTTYSNMTCASGPSQYYCQEVVDKLVEQTKIRYIVTTTGVPYRMKYYNAATGEGADTNVPAGLDNYLVYALANFRDADGTYYDFPSFYNHAKALGSGYGQRIVQPSIDRRFIVGRITGVTKQAAFDLIDRTLAAERKGIYGRLISIRNGNYGAGMGFINHKTGSSITNPDEPWSLQLSTWDESRPECLAYTDQSSSSPSGKAPDFCKVTMNSNGSNEAIPGQPSSRTPKPVSAAMYLGNLDGQAAVGGFDYLLNWRKNSSCTVTLCDDAADPQLCRSRSTDVYKEINTDCVGVSDGFIGYNFQSFPLSYHHLWPTGWHFDSSKSEFSSHNGGGDYVHLGLPVIKDDDGVGDLQSLWVGGQDQVDTPLCYSSLNFSGAPDTSCTEKFHLRLSQSVDLPVQTLATQQFKVSFDVKSKNITNSSTISLHFMLKDIGGNSDLVYYPKVNLITVPVGNSDWRHAEHTFTVDQALHSAGTRPLACPAPCQISGVKVAILTNSFKGGEVGIDNFEASIVGEDVNLLNNSKFDDGYRKVTAGDWSANFLDRMGGVAFWGSVTHQWSGGHSFSQTMGQTMYWWLRGLPLGDSVWLTEGRPSGALIGDPIYSPVRVRVYNLTDDFADRVDNTKAKAKIYIDAVNGLDPSLQETNYSMYICEGMDQYHCDKNNLWSDLNFSGAGGRIKTLAGVLDLTKLKWGGHTLKLAVSSRHISSGTIQNFNSFYSFRNWSSCALDASTAIPEDYRVWEDTDNDGVGNPCDLDDDSDGILDANDEFPLNNNYPMVLPDTGLIFSDDFNRPDGMLADNSNFYVGPEGLWLAISSGRLSGDGTAIVPSQKYTKSYIEADFELYPIYFSSIVHLYARSSNGKKYRCQFMDSNYDSFYDIKLFGDTTSAIYNTGLSVLSSQSIQFACAIDAGQTLKAYFNGNEVLSIALDPLSATHVPSGTVGLYMADGVTADNFRFYDVKP